jgi:hypothetical protein
MPRRDLNGKEIKQLAAVRRQLDAVAESRQRAIEVRDDLIMQLLDAEAPISAIARELRMTRQAIYLAVARYDKRS